jgi:F-type H+-transporting ATPase subunit c
MKKALLLSLTTLLSASASAQTAETATAAVGISDHALFALAAGLAIGIAALGGAFGQGKIGAAAMEGIARNPQSQKTMFASMIISLALIESLVIYALVIAFMLVVKK